MRTAPSFLVLLWYDFYKFKYCGLQELTLKSRVYSILHSSLYMVIAIVLAVLTSISVFSIDSNSPQTLLAQQQQSNFTPAEGNSFEIGNVTFSHHTAAVNGIQMHYVMGGKGDPVVLLHGWPETWYQWRHVMPALAKNYTVIAPICFNIPTWS